MNLVLYIYNRVFIFNNCNIEIFLALFKNYDKILSIYSINMPLIEKQDIIYYWNISIFLNCRNDFGLNRNWISGQDYIYPIIEEPMIKLCDLIII